LGNEYNLGTAWAILGGIKRVFNGSFTLIINILDDFKLAYLTSDEVSISLNTLHI